MTLIIIILIRQLSPFTIMDAAGMNNLSNIMSNRFGSTYTPYVNLKSVLKGTYDETSGMNVQKKFGIRDDLNMCGRRSVNRKNIFS